MHPLTGHCSSGKSGLQEVNDAIASLLLNPPDVTFPLGPKGVFPAKV
jgi:hypothetical protein